MNLFYRQSFCGIGNFMYFCLVCRVEDGSGDATMEAETTTEADSSKRKEKKKKKKKDRDQERDDE